MEPITATIAAALALGAAAGLKSSAEKAVKDAYEALKHLIKGRYSGDTIDALEKKPDSAARRNAVQEELETAGVSKDAEVIEKMRGLLDLLDARKEDLSAVVGVDLESVRAQALRIAGVASEGAGVRVSNADIAGPIDINNVTAGGSKKN